MPPLTPTICSLVTSRVTAVSSLFHDRMKRLDRHFSMHARDVKPQFFFSECGSTRLSPGICPWPFPAQRKDTLSFGVKLLPGCSDNSQCGNEAHAACFAHAAYGTFPRLGYPNVDPNIL